jgi:hypothetical protein
MEEARIVYDPTKEKKKAKAKEPKPNGIREDVSQKEVKPQTEKKDKVAKAKEPNEAKFPVKTFINAYLFIRLPAKVAEAFGAEKGKKTQISIDMNEGSLIIRKA